MDRQACNNLHALNIQMQEQSEDWLLGHVVEQQRAFHLHQYYFLKAGCTRAVERPAQQAHLEAKYQIDSLPPVSR